MTAAPRILDRRARWLRFLAGGACNTLLTYGVYWLLLHVLSYQSAYLIAYVLGIGFAYVFNASQVFQVKLSWRGLLIYPLVYLLQYGVGAAVLWILVEQLGFATVLAPLVVTICLLPLTYLSSKLILKRGVSSQRADSCATFSVPVHDDH